MGKIAATVFLFAVMSAAPCWAQMTDEKREPSGNELSYDSQIDSKKRIKCLYGYVAEKTGDHEAARRIFEDCIARWNDVFSMIFLSEMYDNTGDAGAATALVKRGAEMHDPAGYSRLARFHYGVALCEGHGIRKNARKGRQFLAKAASEGVQEAAKYLAKHCEAQAGLQ